jgi:hypothetical protein
VPYDYRIHPLELTLAAFKQINPTETPDAYLSASPDLDALLQTIADGFRWVRSEGDHAIFEKLVDDDDDGELPWCEPCKSYHATPRDAEHKAALQCKAGELVTGTEDRS